MRLILVSLILWPFALLAQAPATIRHHSFSLDVQTVSNGGTGASSANTTGQNGQIQPYDGTASTSVQILHQQDQHISSNSTNLKATVHNLAAIPDSATLEWYFVGVAVGDTARQIGTKDFIFDQGSQVVAVQPGNTVSIPISSKGVMAVTNRTSTAILSNDPETQVTFSGGLPAVGQTTRQGINMRGWFVRLVDNGKVLAVHGSSATYEDLAKDETKLKTMDVLAHQ